MIEIIKIKSKRLPKSHMTTYLRIFYISFAYSRKTISFVIQSPLQKHKNGCTCYFRCSSKMPVLSLSFQNYV